MTCRRHPMAGYARPLSELRAAGTVRRPPVDLRFWQGLWVGVALSLPLWAGIIQAVRMVM